MCVYIYVFVCMDAYKCACIRSRAIMCVYVSKCISVCAMLCMYACIVELCV